MNRETPLITSAQNQHVAYCRSLRHSRARREAGVFLIEGVRVAEEALNRGWPLELALFDPEALTHTARGTELAARLQGMANSYAVTERALAAATETKAPQGVVLLGRQPPTVAIGDLSEVPMTLVLDGIADAGNAGTILRTAAAFGVERAIFAGETVDPWNGKAVRAGMGAHFHLNIGESTWAELGPALRPVRQVVAADTTADVTIYDLDWSLPTALVLGSEAHGLSEEARARSTMVRIPMTPGVESLNVAAAAAITLAHAAHQRERSHISEG